MLCGMETLEETGGDRGLKQIGVSVPKCLPISIRVIAA
jgi:hypothetical protein